MCVYLCADITLISSNKSFTKGCKILLSVVYTNHEFEYEPMKVVFFQKAIIIYNQVVYRQQMHGYRPSL